MSMFMFVPRIAGIVCCCCDYARISVSIYIYERHARRALNVVYSIVSTYILDRCSRATQQGATQSNPKP